MNNFNLYLDNLVDQGYDITLIKYYFEIICFCYVQKYIYHYYDYHFDYEFGIINEYGTGFYFNINLDY